MTNFNRRDFLKLTGAGCAAALASPSFAVEAAKQKSDIGATFILWGYEPLDLGPALRDISRLGFHAFETFGNVMEFWEDKRGGFGQLIEKYGVPIISSFCNANVLDPAKRKEEVEALIRRCQLLKKYGGKVIEFNAVGSREGYDYKEHKKNLIDALNEYAKVVTDQGLVCALHPHTGTAIETEEEVYFAMENVDTNYMKFGPDVAQIEKGGGDYIKIVRDFMPLIEHVHLKDYAGGDNGYLGYAPLGKGIMDLKTVMEMLEERRGKMAGMIMFELDSDKEFTPVYHDYEAAEISRDYLKKLGYKFNEHRR